MAAFFVFALYLVLAILMLHPLCGAMGTALPSPAEDPLLNCWILSWDLRHLLEGWQGYWNGNIYYPCAMTLAYSENLLGDLPMALPLWLMSGNIVWVVNALALLSFPLSGLGMYLLARRVLDNRPAAFLAGLLYAFAPYKSLHFFHLNLLTTQWFPLVLLFWYESLTRGGLRNNLLFALFLALHCLSSIHYGLFLLFVLPFMTAVFLLRQHDPQTRARVPALVAAGALVVLCLAPLHYPYLLVQRELGIINLPSPNWSASVMSFLTASPLNHLWGWTSSLWGKSECEETRLFPGLLILVFSIVQIRALFGPGVRAEESKPRLGARRLLHRGLEVLMGVFLLLIVCIAATGGGNFHMGGVLISARTVSIPSSILLFLLCLRIVTIKGIIGTIAGAFRTVPAAHLAFITALGLALFFSFYGPFLLLGKVVPVFFGMRVPARLFVLGALVLSLYAGLGMAALLSRVKAPLVRALLFFLLSAGVLAEFACGPLALTAVTPATPGALPRVYEWLKARKDGDVVYEIPTGSIFNQQYMLFSTWHRKRLVNGTSGIEPRYLEDFRLIMHNLPSRDSLMALGDFDVDFLLVHTALLEHGERERLRALRSQAALRFVGDFDGTEVYRTRKDLLPKSVAFEPPDEPLARDGWKITAPTERGFFEGGDSALDGRLVTYWSTNRAALPGDAFVIDMGAVHLASGLGVFLGTDFRTWPRGYVLDVSEDSTTWRTVKKAEAMYPPFTSFFREPKNPYFIVPFEPARCRYVRMTLTRSSQFPWGAHELVIYGRPL